MPDAYNKEANPTKNWLDKDFKYASNKYQRIEEALYKNQYLDSTPTALHQGNTQEKLMKLRNRQEQKELAGHFKFSAKNQFERVYDTLAKNNVSGRSPAHLMLDSYRKE